MVYAAHFTPKAGAAGHQPSSQQVTDAKIAHSRSSQASLQDQKQQLLLANNTAVLDCDRIAPAEQWVLEGDVKIEVGLQHCPRDVKQRLHWPNCLRSTNLAVLYLACGLIAFNHAKLPTQTSTHGSHASLVSDHAFNNGVRQVRLVHTPHWLPIFFMVHADLQV